MPVRGDVVSDLTWQQGGLCMLGLLFAACVAALFRAPKRMALAQFDARVGRDCYREYTK